MKILLIRPKMVQEKLYEPSLGMAYLASVLEKENFQVEILDLVSENNPRLLAREIKNRKPNIIGIGFETENRWVGFETIKLAKSVMPNSFVVAGGVHVSLTAKDTMNNIFELDAIVRGEGEETFLEFCKRVEAKEDLSAVKGLSFRVDKDIIHNPDRSPIQNLDTVPFPAYHRLILRRYSLWKEKGCSMITSRGCIYNCIFCSTTIFWGNQCRTRSIPNILEEIEYMVKKYYVKKINFRDDTFTLDKERVIQFCQALIQMRNKNCWNFSWGCNIRCDKIITKDLLMLMKDAGCKEVGTGVESGASRVLFEIKKKIDLEHVRNIVEWCRQLGLKIYCVFMMNLPTESDDDFKETLEFMDELKKFPHVRLSAPSLLRIYPGTEVEMIAFEKGMLLSYFSWAKPHNMPGINGVPYFVAKNRYKEVEKFAEEADRLAFKLRLKYEGFKIIYFLGMLKRFRIRSIKDIKKYLRKLIILMTDLLLPKIKN